MSEFLINAALATAAAGFALSNYKYRSRLGLSYFEFNMQTIFRPFFYERDEWEPILITFPLAIVMGVLAYVLRV